MFRNNFLIGQMPQNCYAARLHDRLLIQQLSNLRLVFCPIIIGGVFRRTLVLANGQHVDWLNEGTETVNKQGRDGAFMPDQ